MRLDTARARRQVIAMFAGSVGRVLAAACFLLLALPGCGARGPAGSAVEAPGPDRLQEAKPDLAPRAPVGPAPAPAPAATIARDAIRPSAVVLDAVSANDRSAEDRMLDPGREPARLLAFFELRPGQRVAELGAGGGYTAELLARVVGPEGRVYAQNNRFVLERFAEGPFSERLKKPVMKNVIRLDREFDEPFPPEVRDLDLVLNVLFYHDTVWQGTDRARMNRAIYAALRPGGTYGIVDHSARPGSGTSGSQELHRIEEKVVIEELTAAGFLWIATSDFLRNSADTRDWNASPRQAGERRGQSDRFVLKFQKPVK